MSEVHFFFDGETRRQLLRNHYDGEHIVGLQIGDFVWLLTDVTRDVFDSLDLS